MADAEGMKLVFRLGGIGFSLPVDHLVEILQEPVDRLDLSEADAERGLCGSLRQHQKTLPVYDLRHLFGMAAVPFALCLTLMVLPGRDGHFGVVVDMIEGIYSSEEFSPLAMPLLVASRVPLAYSALDLWRSKEILVAGDASRWECLL